MNYIYNNLDFKRALFASQEEEDPDEAILYKDKAFHLLLWSLFEKCAPIPGTEEIIVSGYVLGDGKGDWFNMLNSCKQLRKKFPDRNIRIIAGSAPNHQAGLPHPKIEDCHIVYTKFNDYNPQFSIDQFPDSGDLTLKVQSAALVLLGPVDLPGLYAPLIPLREAAIAVQEYDAASNEDHHCEARLLMGLDASAGIGIFTRTPKEYHLKDLENPRLRELLFSSALSPDEEGYFSSHHLFFSYVDGDFAYDFTLTALAFADQVNPEKQIDICFRCKESFEDFFEEILKGLRGKQNIGTLTLLYYEKGSLLTKKAQLSDTGRELRLIDVGALSPRDFRVLTRISSPITGCTGDNSLATALSYGKIPFYDFPEHKQTFIQNLKNLMRLQFGEQSPLLKFFGSWKMEADLERLQREAAQFGELIRNHYSVNGRLQGAVNERILYRKDKGYAQWVDELQGQYMDEEISIETVCDLICKKIFSYELNIS